MKIVIATHKQDFWFCRICVASIRYYYPAIEILIIKDEKNGKFDTSELEKYWNVKQIDLGKKKFGWSASKVFFLLQAPVGEKYLLLDSDIVFISPFLERVAKKAEENDIVVSAGYLKDPDQKEEKWWVLNGYFDIKKVKEHDADYEYPGYFFNTGHLFITGGALKQETIKDLFDVHKYPYYKNRRVFPAVDQSIYNYLFPTMHKKGILKLATDSFMLLGLSASVKQISLKDIIEKGLTLGLIHWAGTFRAPLLKKMARGDVLIFF